MPTRASGTSLISPTTSEAAVFTSESNPYRGSDGPPFRTVRVNCASASSYPIGARIPELHGTSVVYIPIGEAREFTVFTGESRVENGRILYLRGIGGTASGSWEIVA